MNHQFLLMWCNEGLEYVADITSDEQRVVWAQLQGNSAPGHSYANPHHLILRARYNPQRHYEIYLIEATDGITEQDFRDMFDTNPQTAADTIRRLGHCYFSDREQQDRVVIR